MTNTKLFLLLGTCLSLISINSYAETCTATPDCKSLGYTETSCPDNKGVKCPWNTSLWHCDSYKKNLCQSCYVGWILNSDMTCSQNKNSGKTPIGVVSQQTIIEMGATVKCQRVAVALSDLSEGMTWSNANSKSGSYSASGVKGWHLPTMDELLAVYSNKSAISNGLTAAGGTQLNSNWYWSSFVYSSISGYYGVVNPVNGDYRNDWPAGLRAHVRPVLAF